jgi:hypothetical protein
MFAPVFICDVSLRVYSSAADSRRLSSVRLAGLINISYLTLHRPALYSDASDDGRGDLRQLAPRKTCAKPLASSRSPATVSAGFFILLFQEPTTWRFIR